MAAPDYWLRGADDGEFMTAPGEGLIVVAGGKSNVRACSELSVGEEIEAWHNGRLFHRGRVTEIIPSTDLFWIMDSRTGARKLLDVEALEIVRVEKASIPTVPRTEPTVVWFSSA